MHPAFQCSLLPVEMIRARDALILMQCWLILNIAGCSGNHKNDDYLHYKFSRLNTSSMRLVLI